jgi:hypothetical protein
MEVLAIRAANGLPMVSFGGERSWRTFNYRDYVVSLEWFGPSGRHVDACMVIYNQRRNSEDGAWVIARRRIADYVDAKNNPTPYCFTEAAEALVMFGRACLDMELNALVDTVMQHVDDLVKMPVASQEVRRALAGDAIWEVTRTEKDSGKVLNEAAV